MKKSLTILLLFYSLVVSATNYHVRNSPGEDFQTCAQVNAATFAAGDSVFFNRGDVWREALLIPSGGTAGSYVVYGAYGTGDNPKIYGSKAGTTWTSMGGNVWKSDITFTNPQVTGNCEIEFISGATITWGDSKTDTASLTAEYHWVWVANYIYVYAATDPASRYTSVEVPQRSYCIDTQYKEYIHIMNIDCYFAEYIGIDSYSFHSDHQNKKGCKITGCTVAFIGSGTGTVATGYGIAAIYGDLVVSGCTIHDCGRRGLSLDIYGSGFTLTHAIIENNNFYGGFHTTAVDISVGSGSYTGNWDSVYIRYNTVSDVSTPPYTIQSNQVFLQNRSTRDGGSATTLSNIFIYCNIFKTPNGAGINMEYADKVFLYNNDFIDGSVLAPYTIQLWIDAGCTNIKVKNNIFYSTSSNALYGWPVYCASASSNVDLDYNLFYRINNSLRVISISGTLYYMNTLASLPTWQDNMTTGGDPLFVSASDYHLTASSTLAINTGVGVGLTTDKDGNAWGATPSIGAYEYNSTPPTPTDLPVCSFSSEVGWYSNLKSISVTVMGGWTDDGGGTITDAGIVISTSANPTTSDRKLSFNDMIASSGYFNENITGLKGNVTYHMRIFATNESGTVYSADQVVLTTAYNPATSGGKILMNNGKVVIIK